ncbi:MAG: Crp/Fnr family transcriptional regulator [Ruminococcus callidus]
MEKFFPILKQCPLFAHIAESDLSAMLHCLQVTVQHYDRGQIVIHEGEKAERFGIVLTGAVQLWRIDYSGNRSIMANVEPAQIFGESFVCAEVESIPIQAVASASCDVMLIDGSRILHACGNGCEFHQQVIFHLLQIIARKNLVFHQKLEITSRRSTRESADLSQSASPAAPVQHVYHSV